LREVGDVRRHAIAILRSKEAVGQGGNGIFCSMQLAFEDGAVVLTHQPSAALQSAFEDEEVVEVPLKEGECPVAVLTVQFGNKRGGVLCKATWSPEGVDHKFRRLVPLFPRPP
jgi:hypothetical protein